jgi:hypothetical protein
MSRRLPLEMMRVIAQGADEVQGAANGFGALISCVIRVAPEREGDPEILLRYADREWTIEFVPAAPIPE